MLRALLIVSAAAVMALNHAGVRMLTLPFPAPTEMRLAADDAVTNSALLTLGMRRLASDIMLIRAMVYYGTKESEMSEDYQRRISIFKNEYGGHDAHDGHDHGHYHTGRGIYPDLGPMGRRMLFMDPFWKYPVLFVAGALAFNQDRPEEAIELLRDARRFLPKDKIYLAYTAAVGFHRNGDMKAVVAELTPLLEDESGSTMIKNMVAFMNVRLGDNREAIRLYREILESRDDKYHHVARRALAKLGVPPNKP